jgi:RNA polymerase-binding protein DksA
LYYEDGTTVTERELNTYRRQLLALGNRIKGDYTGLADEALRATGGEASGNLSNAPLHLADLGTDNFEQELSLSLLENERQTLEHIKNALGRIDQRTYGVCERCGKDIPPERLNAVPFTSHCIRCARKSENGNGRQSVLSGL